MAQELAKLRRSWHAMRPVPQAVQRGVADHVRCCTALGNVLASARQVAQCWRASITTIGRVLERFWFQFEIDVTSKIAPVSPIRLCLRGPNLFLQDNCCHVRGSSRILEFLGRCPWRPWLILNENALRSGLGFLRILGLRVL